MNKRNEYDLKDRLIDYTVRIIALSEALPDTKAGNHIASQILRSGTSPAPNYGEATSAESIADFIHKLKVAFKELRETEVWLKVIEKAEMIKPPSKLKALIQETDELIAILFTSVTTAKKRAPRAQPS
jgi:four helix bundle protein